MSFTTVSERLAAMEDALRELVQALGPCGSIDKQGNCGNHFATCPCPVEEADLLLAKMRETTPSPDPFIPVSPCSMTTTCGKCGNNRCPVKALDAKDLVEKVIANDQYNARIRQRN